MQIEKYCDKDQIYLVDEVFPRYDSPGFKYGDIVETAVIVLPPASSEDWVVVPLTVVSEL